MLASSPQQIASARIFRASDSAPRLPVPLAAQCKLLAKLAGSPRACRHAPDVGCGFGLAAAAPPPQRRSVVAHAVKLAFPCSRCGMQHQKWTGRCSNCQEFGCVAIEGVEVQAAGKGGAAGGGAGVQAVEGLLRGRPGPGPGGAAHAAASAPPPRSSSGSSGPRPQAWLEAGPAAGRRSSGGSGGGGFGGPSELDVPLSVRHMARGRGGDRRSRIQLPGRTGAELGRVLGGGVVAGSLVLVGGDPGIGKSTLMLQMAAMVAHPELGYDDLEDEAAAADPDSSGFLDLEAQGPDRGEEEDLAGMGRRERAPPGQGQMVEEGEGREGGAWDDVQGGSGADARDGARAGATARGSAGADADSDAPSPSAAFGSSSSSGLPGCSGSSASLGSSYDEGEEDAGGWGAGPRSVLYVTAEETGRQVADRAVRMGLGECEGVMVLARAELTGVADIIARMRPTAVVLDSISTVYLNTLPHAAGSIVQVRECGAALMRLAKQLNIAVFIIGHVTKAGDMAGPNTLAHMVDTVLYLEGDDASAFRLLRVHKNRHGPSEELGVFKMGPAGLAAAPNHNALFLESRRGGAAAAGDAGAGGGGYGPVASSVVGVALQGNRAMLGEVQALVSPVSEHASVAALYRSAPVSVDRARLASLCMILDKHVPTLDLASQNVVINVVGGVQMKDVGADLAMAVAIASSYYDQPLPSDLAAMGEVDLGGYVRGSFKRLDVRLAELAKMGFRRAIIPRTAGWEKYTRDRRLAGLQITAVGHVTEALRAALGDVVDHRPAYVKPPPRSKAGGAAGWRRNGGGGAAWPRGAAAGGLTAAYAAAGAALEAAPRHAGPGEERVGGAAGGTAEDGYGEVGEAGAWDDGAMDVDEDAFEDEDEVFDDLVSLSYREGGDRTGRRAYEQPAASRGEASWLWPQPMQEPMQLAEEGGAGLPQAGAPAGRGVGPALGPGAAAAADGGSGAGGGDAKGGGGDDDDDEETILARRLRRRSAAR